MRSLLLLFLPVATFFGGCVPYGVGTTARPAPRNEVAVSSLISFVPGLEYDDTYAENADSDDGYHKSSPSGAGRYPLFDTEVRYGLDERSDFGVRVTSLSGIVATYKRLLAGGEAPAQPALAVVGGAGFVNLGNHLHGEVTLVASGSEAGMVTPYGGLRAMHDLALSTGFPRDTPTLGAFAGVRLGTLDLGVSPEIGVFYDESALGLRSSSVIVVPTIAVHGRDLLRTLFGR